MFGTDNTKRVIKTFFIAFVVLSIFSTSSYLYSINPWSDANVLFTIGRGIVNGKEMYVDLFDHKGPLLYLLYALASLISQESFIGVFVIEVISFTIFLFFTSKIVELYSEKTNYVLLLLISVLICTSNAFNFGGGSVEEFILPIITYNIYICLYRIHNSQSFNSLDCIKIVISAILIFWMKYSLCGFYIGLAIALIIYQMKKDNKQLVRCLYVTLISIFVGLSITVLFYYLMGILDGIFNVYLGFNLSSYSVASDKNIIEKLFSIAIALLWYIKNNFCILPILFLALIMYITKYKNYEGIFVVCTLFFGYLISVIGGQTIRYYILPVFSYIFLIMICVDKFKGKKIMLTVLLVSSVISIYNNQNITRLLKQDIVQNEIVSVMNEYKENPSIMMFRGYDEGFYLKANYIPSCKYFTNINAEIDGFEDTLNKCIVDNKYDFLISMSNKEDIVFEDDIQGYKLLDVYTSKYEYDDVTRRYYLYINEDLID